MKKLLVSFFVCLAVIILLPNVGDISASALTEGNYTYTVSSNQATITDFPTYYSGELVVPETLGGYPVTYIGPYAFKDCSKLTSIIIPNSVTYIGYEAFCNCFGLASVEIGKCVTSIGNWSFANCTGLTSLTIPNSVTAIGVNAFNGCNSLESISLPFVGSSRTTSGTVDAVFGYIFGYASTSTSGTTKQEYASNGTNYYYIPSSLKSVTITDATQIPYGAFYGCSNLTSITLNDGVTSIGGFAFKGCSGLTSITIPNSVTSIACGAFRDCNSLESITLPFVGSSRTASGSTGAVFGYIFDYTTTSSSGTTNQYYASGSGKYYYIPLSLKSVTITDATQIPYGAFYGCSWFTSITINDGVTSIGLDSFRGCTGLTNIAIPNSVTSIGTSAFNGCTRLTSITIPNSVTSVGNGAFRNCNSLESITLPFVGTSRTASGTLDAVFGYIFDYESSSASGTTNQYYASGSGKYYYIPSSLKSVTITDATQIPYGAFYGCYNLTSITLNDGVTSICDYAFYNCTGLTNVQLGNSVTSIGVAAFRGCEGLTSITIPNSVTSIGNSAFAVCTGLTNITIPNSVTSIGSSAFYNCTGLTEITIPDSVTSIGNTAFKGCTDLTSITIPNSVTSMGNGAFRGCNSLESITLPFVGTSRTASGTLDAVFGYIFDYTSSSASGTTLQYYANNSSQYYYIPSSLKSVTITDATQIPYGAFYGCSNLTSITLNDGVTSIGQGAFKGCTNLSNFTFPNSVTSIGAYVFQGCTGLTNIRISNGVTSIGNSVFYGFTGLTNINIPNSVTSIAGSAFNGCTGLTNITIPNSVTSIGTSAFNGCTGITNITIPNSVTSIGASAFNGCTGLTNITIPNSVTSIGTSAFYGCNSLESITLPFVGSSRMASGTEDAVFGYIFGYTSSSASGTTQQYYSSSSSCYYYIPSSLKSVTITDATQIPYGAFYGCSMFTNITINDGVTSIGVDSFRGCTGLTNIAIPNSVTSIGTSAFNGCTRLTEITVPNSVTSIGNGAFRGCSSLESITLPFVGSSRTADGTYGAVFGLIFGDTSSSSSGTTLQYYSSGNYKYYYIPSSLKSVTITDATQIPYGAFYGCSNLTSITLNDGVTSMGDRAFYNCTGLTSITIPDSVTSIGEYSFYGCTSLASITIPNNVTSIGDFAFHSCTGFTNITIPDRVTSIGDAAFSHCTGLTSITIPNSVTSIGNSAFYNCTGLTSITIPNSVTSIDNAAFYNCTGLTSITVPNSVTSMGKLVFRGCSSLESITLPFVGSSRTANGTYDAVFGYIFDYTTSSASGTTQQYYKSGSSYYYYIPSSLKSVTITDATQIPYGAFYGCSNITTININDGVTTIDASAFYGCTGLTSITIPNSVTSIGNGAFRNCNSLESITLPFVGSSRTANGTYDAVFGYIFGDTSSSASGTTLQYYSSGKYKYYYIPSSLKSVTTTDATQIPYGAFFECSNLTSITINDGVTTIGGNAFRRCTGLTSITIPNSVTSIEAEAFGNCTGLTNITIPNSVTSLGDKAFLGCTGLTSIIISDNVTSIGYGVFSSCESLTSITIPDNVTSIGDSAFSCCESLTSITIPDSVISIGQSAFSGCKGLTNVQFGNSVTSIGGYALTGCSRLTNITLPDGVTSIGDYAFYNCTGLISITIPNSVTSIGSGAFYNCNALAYVFYTGSQDEKAAMTIGNQNDALLNAAWHYNARDHVYNCVVTPATCVESGLKTYTCTFCEEEYTEVIPATGHTEETIPAVVPTCTTTGSTVGTKCSVCDTVLDAPEVVPALGHTEEPIPAVAPTCTKTGLTEGTKCSVCGEILTEQQVIPALGHTSEIIPAVAPTCTETGLTEGTKCSVCGEILTEQQVISAKGHSYDSGVITTTPTCEGKGIKTFTCTVCGHSYTEDVAALGHTEKILTSVAATCTKTGLTEGKKCSVCGKILVAQETVPMIPHDYKWVTDREPTCYQYGLKHRECSVCQAHEDGSDNTMIAPTGNHTYDWVIDVNETCGADGTKHEACTLDGCTATRSVGTVIPATGKHTYTDNCDKTCNGCSTTRTAPHTYTSDYDTKCNQCGITRTCNTYTGTTGSLTYRIDPSDDGGNVTITKCATSASGALTIPASISNVPVTSIGDSAFLRCSKLTSVTIPDSVISLGNEAFRSCTGLTSITIGKGVTSIGDNALSYCSKLTSITIPNSVASIGDDAFRSCSGLTSVTIPNSVTSIGADAFAYCSGLTSITIGSGVTSIGTGAFSICSALTKVNVTDLAAWCNINFGDSSSNPLNYSKALYINDELVTDLVIPNGVTSIGDNAFCNCTGLTSITIPDSVTSIGKSAFTGCSKITKVNITDLAAWCKVELSEPLYYAHDLYLNNEQITDLVIPSGITSISSNTFRNCSGITSVTIPDSVTSIDVLAFNACQDLTSITVDNDNTYYSSQDGVLFNKTKTNLICYPAGRNATYTIPNGVTSIDTYAFYSCKGLTNITIPDSVTSIGNFAFASSTGLTSITIGNGVISIGPNAFAYCSGLISVTIPNNVTSIDHAAFNGCTGLKNITIGNGVTSIGDIAFNNCPELTNVYYRGSETQKGNITIGSSNSYLTEATWYYNSCIMSATHTEQILPAIAATCTTTGLTEGAKCTVCDNITTEQSVIPAKGHSYDSGVITTAPTCEEKGIKTFTCTVCGHSYTEDVAALGHTEEIMTAVASTCTKTGLTDGKKCSICGKILVAQEIVPMIPHDYKWVTDKEPTCNTSGLKHRECSVCQAHEEGSDNTMIAPTGDHKSVEIPAIAPTCTTEGATAGTKCSVCDTVLDVPDVVPALGHKPGEAVIENNVAPDCVNKGSYDSVVYCTVCNAETSRKTIDIPALGHTEEIIPSVAPTCTKTGLTEGTKCSVCGVTITEQEIVPALGHKPDEAVIENNVDPDCVNAGSYDMACYCSVCNAETSRENITVPALGHSYAEGVVTTTPTCEGKGIKTFTCTVCGHSYTEDVAALGHTEEIIPAVGSTCTETGLAEGKKCSVCDKVLVPQSTVSCIPHDYKWVTDKEPTCYEVGLKHRECSVCQAHEEGSDNTMIVPTGNHIYDWVIDVKETCGANGTKHEACTTEGCTSTRSVGTVIPATGDHTSVTIPAIAPTCTDIGYTEGTKCSVCDTVLNAPEVVAALGHKPAEAVVENNVAPDCVNTGSYDSVIYCSVCGYEISRESKTVPALGHTSETISSVAPTCTETGLTEGIKCSVCNVILTEQQVIPILGHSYDDGTITTTPTCEGKGIKTFTCTVCGHSYTENVAALGHTEETISAIAPTCTETGLTEGTKCSVCGKTIIAQQVVAALGHKPGEAVVENNVNPDCVNKGSYDSVVYCSVCGDEIGRKTINVSALGHTSEIIPAVAPTCTKTGLTEGTKCSVCGVIITQQKAVPALGHSYNSGVITTVPTCEGKGVKTFTCSVCDHSYTESVSALGHNETVIPAVSATCTETGLTAGVKCSVCGEILTAQQEVPANGHTFKWVVSEDSTCGEDGSKYQECIVCGGIGKTELIPATGNHIYSWVTVLEPTCGTEGMQREECIICGGKGNTQKLAATGNHVYNWVVSTAPTCSTAGSRYQDCINCDINGNVETIMPTGNHTYTNKCDVDCNICHTIRDNIIHTYSNKCDEICDVCGATRVIIHSYTTAITKATTLKNGSIVKKCTVCGKVVSSSAIRYAKTFNLSATSYTYDGKAKKPTVKVYDSIGCLIAASNYTVSYKNNKNVGKATVTITFKGNYLGTKTLNFTINPKATSVSKLTAAKKSLKVSIKKQTKEVTGYEIQYSTSKNFKSAKKVTIKKAKTTSTTIKKLKAKKTYYVRVRTFKTVNGKKYYSTWSTTKSKKTK